MVAPANWHWVVADLGYADLMLICSRFSAFPVALLCTELSAECRRKLVFYLRKRGSKILTVVGFIISMEKHIHVQKYTHLTEHMILYNLYVYIYMLPYKEIGKHYIYICVCMYTIYLYIDTFVCHDCFLVKSRSQSAKEWEGWVNH